MRYNQKLNNVVQYMSAIDANGSYYDIIEEYQDNEITLSEAISECREILVGWYDDSNDSDVLDWIKYIDYY